ncbi:MULTISPECIES: hypothetical protein [unclassified Bacillus cereus group]|uniref:hypothetical protein n=1 Tax=unclassified Bacillus cereus group TaxID=2750818 RepID=UPI001F577D26|nr:MULTISPECIES: hypothetical protein [unclassified Bacillus cereus group]
MQKLVEKRVEQYYLNLKEVRTNEGLGKKSLFEEALSSYFCENYRLAFISAYIYLIEPIAVNSKRLHKKKNRKKFRAKTEYERYKFNLINALEESTFLTDELKVELSKSYKVKIQYSKKAKEYNLLLNQIRNITLHPEDDRHRFITDQLDYKELALQVLDLAPRIQTAYNNYLLSPRKERRKVKEYKAYQKICVAS